MNQSVSLLVNIVILEDELWTLVIFNKCELNLVSLDNREFFVHSFSFYITAWFFAIVGGGLRVSFCFSTTFLYRITIRFRENRNFVWNTNYLFGFWIWVKLSPGLRKVSWELKMFSASISRVRNVQTDSLISFLELGKISGKRMDTIYPLLFDRDIIIIYINRKSKVQEYFLW